ncbi:MAG: alpha/beta fold hydrolase, partial [bacterium]
MGPAASSAPTLLILHGLEGSSRSHYVRGLAGRAAAGGWRAAAMNFRSCGGEANRLPRLYHSGETDDLDFAAASLAERFGAPLVVVGFSLGGNVLLKWLGERRGEAPPELRGAAAVSASFAPGECAVRLDSLRGAIYRRHLLKSAQRKAEAFSRRHPGLIDPGRVRRARGFVEFDRWATAPIHGFRDETDYYADASSLRFIPEIKIPTLILSSRDDPIVSEKTFPAQAAGRSPWLRGVLLPSGGHCGFIEGRNPFGAGFWADGCVLSFFFGLPGRGRRAGAALRAGARLGKRPAEDAPGFS